VSGGSSSAPGTGRKIVGIGLNKTGTTTLAACLKSLGYQRHVTVSAKLLASYRNGNIEDIFRVVEANDTFEDWPFPLAFKEIFYRFGERARFVLTTRKDARTWVESLKTQSLRTPPQGHLRLLAYGYNYPHGLEQEHMAIYERHNEEVRAFFRHHRSEHLLLEVCWERGDGWPELCGFLGVPVPSRDFPHQHKGSAPVAKRREAVNLAQIDQQLKLLRRL
jgi:hypothetical protein